MFDYLHRTAHFQRSQRAQTVVRGFVAFLLSVTVRQYAWINLPLLYLLRFLAAIRGASGFLVPFRPPTSPPLCYVDATPFHIAYKDTGSREEHCLPLANFQVHNELAALLLAAVRFGPSRVYVTDCAPNLSLQKRSAVYLLAKIWFAMRNLQIRFVRSAFNLADPVSRPLFYLP